MPETLHALIAARLDGLAPEERSLVQDGAVLGKTFTKQGLAALTGLRRGELEPMLAALVRKEVLSVQADPRSPERGQYAFLQDIVKQVAYETISRRERKAKHLAAAEYLLALPGAARRTRSSRSSPRTTSTPRCGARRARRRGDSRSRHGRCSSAPASGPRRSPPTPRRSARSSGRPS